MEEKNTDALEIALSHRDAIKRFYRFALANNYSVALWRMPNENLSHLIIDVSGEEDRRKVDLEEIGQGFVFSPFDNFNNDRAILIHSDIYLGQNNEVNLSNRLDFETKEAVSRIVRETFRKEEYLPEGEVSSPVPHETTKEAYKQMVAKAVSQFSDEKFQKVVISRAKLVDLPAAFDPVDFFFGLCPEHAAAFVSLVFMPGYGLWMGASPEPLISVDQNKIFRTAAVAGTKLYTGHKPPLEVAWTQKEIEEQAMVCRYIINCFKKIRLREYEEVGPRTAIAGNLAHLKTDFVVDMDATNFPQLGSVMLELLHPTSAVCGMPKEMALTFINEHENYDRLFYSGYLGPVNFRQASGLFVNIRCMQLLGDQAALYAGAGITHNSDAEKEWIETEIKMKTMLNAIRGLTTN